MTRGRYDGSPKKHLVASVCGVAVFLGLLYVFQRSIFGSQNSGSSALEYGSKSLKRLGASYLGSDDDADSKQDESSSSIAQGDGEADIVPKSFPVSLCATLNSRHISLYFFMNTFFCFGSKLVLYDSAIIFHE